MYTYVYVKKEINIRRRKKSLSKGSRPKKIVFLAYKFVKGGWVKKLHFSHYVREGLGWDKGLSGHVRYECKFFMTALLK